MSRTTLMRWSSARASTAVRGGRHGRRGRLLALGFLAACIVYGWLLPSTTHPTGWEHVVAAWVHVGPGSRMSAITTLVIRIGSPTAVAAMTVGLVAGLAASGRIRTAGTALLAVVGGSVGAELTKHLVGRHIGAGRAFGYPSGHSAGAAAVLMTMVLVAAPDAVPAALRRVAAVVPIVVGGVVGLAMAAHGWHYAADVIGGVAFGTCVPLALLGWPVAVEGPAAPTVEAMADPAPSLEVPARQPVSANRRFGVREEEPSVEATPELAAETRK